MDMSGNLWEWCASKYSKPKGIQVDASGDSRVLRGGSFFYVRDYASCVFRYNFNPDGGGSNFGFRVVVSAPIASL